MVQRKLERGANQVTISCFMQVKIKNKFSRSKPMKPKHKCFKVSHGMTVTTKILAEHFREIVLSRISITAEKLKELGGIFGSVVKCG